MGALAVLNLICGLALFFALSLVITEPLISVLIVLVFCSASTAAFGLWLANDVLGPIDNITLLAKSLERSPTAALPRSTGADETDELLHALHRNSRQLQNIITLTEEVAAGRTDTALTPLENSDRLTSAFQRLIGRVGESIDAKTELETLRTAVDRLTADTAGIRSGNFNARIRTDLAPTKDLAETFRYLISRLNELSLNVSIGSKQAARSVNELRTLVRSAAGKEDANNRRIRTAAETLSNAPNAAAVITQQLGAVISAGGSTRTQFAAGSDQTRKVMNAVAGLRKTLTDDLHKLQRLRDQLNIVPQIAKSADDLARRSSMVALNTNMRSGESVSGTNVGIALLADEISTLSYRAEEVSKELAAIKTTAVRDIQELEAAFGNSVTAVSAISAETSQILEAVEALGDFIGRVTELPAQIAADPHLNGEGETAKQLLEAYLHDDEELSVTLGMCEEKMGKLAQLIDGMKETVSAIAAVSPAAQAEDAMLDLSEEPVLRSVTDEAILDIWSENQ